MNRPPFAALAVPGVPAGCITFVYCDHTDGAGKSSIGEPITPADVERIAAAVTRQLSGEVSAEWGGENKYRIGANDGSDVDPSAGEIEMGIFKSADVANAAGYHATTPIGQPYGRLFLDECTGLFSGALPLSGIASHESIEIKLDPGANRYATRLDGLTQDAIEGCDAVEDVLYDNGDGVPVSDFLTQSAFEPGAVRPYSYRDSLESQYDTTPGGYRIVQTVSINASNAGHSFQATAGFNVVVEHKEAFTDLQMKRKSHPASRTSKRGVHLGS